MLVVHPVTGKTTTIKFHSQVLHIISTCSKVNTVFNESLSLPGKTIVINWQSFKSANIPSNLNAT